MLRVQNLVPEVYPDQSRDFQMFCRLYDVVFNSVKNSIDSLQYVTSTQLCDSSILELLQDKLGFFSSLPITDADLRLVLQAFPLIIRYKGSQQAINYIVNLYARLAASDSSSNQIHVKSIGSAHVIEISSESPIVKTELLIELLKYVLPTGYTLDYYTTYNNYASVELKAVSELYYHVSDPAYKTHIVISRDDIQKSVQNSYNMSKELPNVINVANVSNNMKSDTN